MHKSATKCNETIGKWCKNKHGASKIIDTFEMYQLPNVGRSLPDQAFDTTQDSKKIQVHPTDPNNTTSIAVNLDPA
jgi:hypothetical protein